MTWNKQKNLNSRCCRNRRLSTGSTALESHKTQQNNVEQWPLCLQPPDDDLSIMARRCNDPQSRTLAHTQDTHSISGVAKDLTNRLVDCNIQYSSFVTWQCNYRTRGDVSSPQSDCSVATACDQQLQSGIVTCGSLFSATFKQTTEVVSLSEDVMMTLVPGSNITLLIGSWWMLGM
ncbi:hypothetical protein INR49_013799 [Caranx melampygus]|nr:hypothetical protein INR49_013799 [Caranx melampygus]